MTFKDLIKFSIQNLFRSKLRTMLTTIGVAIGSGALVAMVSYGTGTQKNFTDEFQDLELFNTVRITSTRVDLSTLLSFSRQTTRSTKDQKPKNEVVLTDSVLTALRDAIRAETKAGKLSAAFGATSAEPIVYPEVVFPSKLQLDTIETAVMTEALPAAMASSPGYNQIHYGKFFTSDSSDEIVISEILLNRMGLDNPAAAIGKEIKLTTISLDVEKMLNYANAPLAFAGGMPVSEQQYTFKIGGILSKDIQKLSNGFRLIMPIETSKKVNRLNFLSTLDLLRKTQQMAGYQAIIVRAASQKDAERIKGLAENMGLNPTSFTDQFNEFKKLFLLFDMALGIVGTIALIVATLGITNTMIMSIMERYREIGIMKALGASDDDVRKIFFVESAVIGFVGGVVGIVLGWLTTRGINAVANIFVEQQSGTSLDFFYFPLWLVGASVFFSVVISLLAGLYPANRAAKIEPVEALRYQ